MTRAEGLDPEQVQLRGEKSRREVRSMEKVGCRKLIKSKGRATEGKKHLV